MQHRGWLTLLLLSPFAFVVVGMQVVVAVSAVSLVQAAFGATRDSPSSLDRGLAGLARAAEISDGIWSSLPARVLAWNPVLLGGVDDVSSAAHAADEASAMLGPVGELVQISRGLDGREPLIVPGGFNTHRIPDMAAPLQGVQAALSSTQEALAAVPGKGPVGQQITALAGSLAGVTSDLSQVNAAALLALPDMPGALGANEPKRYLVCALNDAEIFASGGAPLSAVMVQLVKGQVSVPISGQLESKLSPNNPPITWDHVAGPPWLRDNKKYPFVNSNFHPDFRTASADMRRAWAALGYPQVDGVITIDLNAVSRMLDWAGPVQAGGHGEVTGETLIPKVLVGAYRELNSAQGVIERHARNDALVRALGEHFAKPWNALPTLRGTLRVMPERHIQASFGTPGLSAAVAALHAEGSLSSGPGDLLGVFSQSGPNKLSVFQDRAIDQEVTLDAHGGAAITRTVRITNAVPEGLSGHVAKTHGYLALRARMRVAHRVPPSSTELSVSTGTTPGLVPVDRTGPFPDDRGGQVMWQGHETSPRDTTVVTLTYRLPAGTFRPGTYELWADPQPMTIPTRLRVHISAPPGVALPATDGWSRDGDGMTWQGGLVGPQHLRVG